MNRTESAAEHPKSRILVVDDHPAVREGLALQIGLQPDLEVSGEAEDVGAALALLSTARPDVAIIDISLKNGNGIDLIKRIRARDNAVRLLVWSMHPENLYAERALRAGAMGYVHKGKATRDIIEAIRTVLAGKMYLSPDLSTELLGRLVGNGPQADLASVDSLSDRELESFQLMGQGLTTQQIAARMHVSPKTVETYRARIKEKLHVDSMASLIQRAAQWVLESGC